MEFLNEIQDLEYIVNTIKCNDRIIDTIDSFLDFEKVNHYDVKESMEKMEKERDDWKKYAEYMEKKRDECEKYAKSMKKKRDEWKKYAEIIEKS